MNRAYHHGNLRHALIEATLALVAERGPRGFSLTETARRAGVSAAAPYRHFADRESLLAAAAEEGFRELVAHVQLTSAAPADSITNRMVNLALTYVRYALTNPERFRIMFGSQLDMSRFPTLFAANREALGIVLAAITEAQSTGELPGADPWLLCTPAWALIHGFATLAIDGVLTEEGQAEQPLVSVETAMRMLMAGIGTEPGSAEAGSGRAIPPTPTG